MPHFNAPLQVKTSYSSSYFTHYSFILLLSPPSFIRQSSLSCPLNLCSFSLFCSSFVHSVHLLSLLFSSFCSFFNMSKSSTNTLSPLQLDLVYRRLGVLDPPLSPQNEYMLKKIQEMSIDTALHILRTALVEHADDVNFSREDYTLLKALVANEPSGLIIKGKEYLQIEDRDFQIRLEASLIHFHLPYPEIRAITDPYDDPQIPVETFRVYVIALTWTILGLIVNNFFVHRMPLISLSSHTVQILLLPSGKIWERYVPKRTISIFGRNFELNPGTWTYKEMMLATIMYSCLLGIPYVVYNIFVMKLDRFYGLKWVTLPYQFMLAIATQFLGFGFALIMKRVCIYPAKALWPTILPTIVLNRALLREDDGPPVHGWKISRYSFFCVVFAASFCYNWIPLYFFTALLTFNWPTWFAPFLVHLANVTGLRTGLGLNPLPSFDWNIIDAGACLTLPFYTYANHYLGALTAFFVILSVYYTNNKWTAYFPINSNRLFNNKAELYKVHDLLNDKLQFDPEKYKEIGPPYFSAANLVLYGAYFALYPFAILYNFVVEWLAMKSAFKNVYLTVKEAFTHDHNYEMIDIELEDIQDENHQDRVTSPPQASLALAFFSDPHCKMMSRYEDVPDWWFLAILATSTCFALATIVFYPSETPIWGIFFTIAINFVFLIPITSIASVTGFSFGLNVLVELIVGYAIPNSGIALITLKSFGYNIDSQASNYITDQKLAHYAKIPPRAIFRGQLISTMISVIVALGIANWQIDNVPDICDPKQKDKLLCPGANTFFYLSIQYGEIGPAKVFTGVYPVLKWCFLLGALLVIPCAWFKKNGPAALTRYFQPTIILGGFLAYAPYNLLYYTTGLYFSFGFMYYIKKHYLLWWEKYNYILTSALLAGVAFSALVMFFMLLSPLHWWGNEIDNMGIEGRKVENTWLKAADAEGGYVGLRKGSFP